MSEASYLPNELITLDLEEEFHDTFQPWSVPSRWRLQWFWLAYKIRATCAIKRAAFAFVSYMWFASLVVTLCSFSLGPLVLNQHQYVSNAPSGAHLLLPLNNANLTSIHVSPPVISITTCERDLAVETSHRIAEYLAQIEKIENDLRHAISDGQSCQSQLQVATEELTRERDDWFQQVQALESLRNESTQLLITYEATQSTQIVALQTCQGAVAAREADLATCEVSLKGNITDLTQLQESFTANASSSQRERDTCYQDLKVLKEAATTEKESRLLCQSQHQGFQAMVEAVTATNRERDRCLSDLNATQDYLNRAAAVLETRDGSRAALQRSTDEIQRLTTQVVTLQTTVAAITRLSQQSDIDGYKDVTTMNTNGTDSNARSTPETSEGRLQKLETVVSAFDSRASFLAERMQRCQTSLATCAHQSAETVSALATLKSGAVIAKHELDAATARLVAKYTELEQLRSELDSVDTATVCNTSTPAIDTKPDGNANLSERADCSDNKNNTAAHVCTCDTASCEKHCKQQDEPTEADSIQKCVALLTVLYQNVTSITENNIECDCQRCELSSNVGKAVDKGSTNHCPDCPVSECPFAECPVTKCPVAECPVNKCPVAECPTSECPAPSKCPVTECPVCAATSCEQINCVSADCSRVTNSAMSSTSTGTHEALATAVASVNVAHVSRGARVVLSHTSQTYRYHDSVYEHTPTTTTTTNANKNANAERPEGVEGALQLFRASIMHALGVPLQDGRPEDALDDDRTPGSCWPMHGRHGMLTIEFPQAVHVLAVTIEHGGFSGTHSDYHSALRDFEVTGSAILGHGTRVLIKDTFVPKHTHPGNGHNSSSHGSVASATYTVASSLSAGGCAAPYVDDFREASETKDCLSKFVSLAVLSNHGNRDYTCIYGFQVHARL